MYIVGIDIAKRKHEAAVIDGEGTVIIKPFSLVFLCPEFESVLRRFLCFQMCRAGRLPVSLHRSPCVPLCARLRDGVECVPAKAH